MPARGCDVGSVTAELAVLTPMLVLGMLFVVFAGRLGQAEQDVAQAAAEAARTASLVRGSDVDAAAAMTARSNLAGTGVRCLDLAVDAVPTVGDPVDSVTVTVRCEVDLAGLTGFGLPRHRTLTAQATEVIDVYRGTTQ